MPDHRQAAASYMQSTRKPVNSSRPAIADSGMATYAPASCSDPNCQECRQVTIYAAPVHADGLSGNAADAPSALPAKSSLRRSRSADDVGAFAQEQRQPDPILHQQPYSAAPNGMAYTGRQFGQAAYPEQYMQLTQPGQYYTQAAQINPPHNVQFAPTPFETQKYRDRGEPTNGHHQGVSSSSPELSSSPEEPSPSFKVAVGARRLVVRAKDHVAFCRNELDELRDGAFRIELLCVLRNGRRRGASANNSIAVKIALIKYALHPLTRKLKRLSKQSEELREDWKKLIEKFRVVRTLAGSLNADARDEHDYHVRHGDCGCGALQQHMVCPTHFLGTIDVILNIFSIWASCSASSMI